MKKILKPLVSVIAVGAISLSLNVENNNVYANEITSACKYDAMAKTNPDFSTMNCLLTETALKYNVPPEIVKAIAEGENSGWRHFDQNGEAIVTADNGIGIMQITNQSGVNEERLKNDIAYNIEKGVEILSNMFDRKDLPKINDGERDVIENWYFAVMAYNGTKPVNSPIVQATGKRNTTAYQEKIFRIIENSGLIDLVELPFTREDFEYDTNSNQNIKFITMNYKVDGPLTKTKHQFKTNQKVKVTTNNVKIRQRPTTSNSTVKGTLSEGEIVTITGPFVYDEGATNKNHFVWYPVKTNNGTVGYVASSYLDYYSTPTVPTNPTAGFKDLSANHWAKDEINFLVEKDIIKGVSEDKFGVGQGLTRWQAVLLLNRAQNVSLANRPDPGFKDVPKDYKYYAAIAAAVDEGLFSGTSTTKFEPNKILTRSEMATVLQRIYKFPAPSSSHPFTDVNNEWFADAVARLYAAGITTGATATTFNPNATIKREEFAVFLARAMNESYRLK